MAGKELRYFIFFIVFLILLFPSVCFSQSLEDSISFIHTPQQLVNWLSNEFVYQWGIYDDWQSPQEMIHSKTGDCIDFAILASTVLRHLGIFNNILIIKFEKLKVEHAICIWKEKDGFYSFISNRKLFYTKKRTIEEAIGKFYPDWERIIFANLTNEEKQYMTISKKKNRKRYRQNTFLYRRNKPPTMDTLYSPFGNNL